MSVHVSHGGLCCAPWLSSLNIPVDHEKDSVSSFFGGAASLLTHIATLPLPFIPAITPFVSGKDLNRSHFKARYCIYRAMMAVRGFFGMICRCLVETLRHF